MRPFPAWAHAGTVSRAGSSRREWRCSDFGSWSLTCWTSALFEVGFLLMVAVPSTGIVPDPALSAAQLVQTLVQAAAMFCLGAEVDVRTLLVTGRRAAAVGLAAWLTVAGVSYAGVLVLR